MYRSGPTTAPHDDQLTCSHFYPTSTTVKPPPHQNRRPNEMPPELPQVSKEWLASPHNLLIHSTYISSSPTRTRQASATSHPRRWSSFLPIPAPNSISTQETVSDPPHYGPFLGPQALSSNAPSESTHTQLPTARPRRRSTGWHALHPQPRPRPQTFTSPPPNPNSWSHSSHLDSQILTCSPSNSSFVMVFASNSTIANPPTVELDRQSISRKKNKFFKTVSSRLRSLFHPSLGQPPKHTSSARTTTLDRARNNRNKRHSTLFTPFDFGAAHQHQLSIPPSSMINRRPWSHADIEGGNALHSLSPRFPRDPETVQIEGDTALIEQVEEEEEGEDQADEERRRQTNRSQALRSLENFQNDKNNNMRNQFNEEGKKVLSKTLQGQSKSPSTIIPTIILIEDGLSSPEEKKHALTPDESTLLNFHRSPNPYSPKDTNIFPSHNAQVDNRHSFVGPGFHSVAYSKADSHFDKHEPRKGNELTAGEQESIGVARVLEVSEIDQTEFDTQAEGIPDSTFLLKDNYPNSISNRPSSAGRTLPPIHHPWPSSLLVASVHSHSRSRSSGDRPLQHNVMPILSQTRASNFPFRRRRASSPSTCDASIDPVNIASSSADTTTSAPRTTHLLSTSHSKSCHPSHPNPSPPCDQPNSDQSSRVLRPFRHRSTHFEKFQAKMATVKLRSSTLNPTSSRTFSSGFSNLSPSANLGHNPPLHPLARVPDPIDTRLSWETSPTALLTDMPLDSSPRRSIDSHHQPLISPSFVSMIDHNSDSSSHLTLTSEPCSNKLSKSSSRAANLPPRIELSLSFHSSNIAGLPYVASPTSPKAAPPAHPSHTLPPQASRPSLEGLPRVAKSVPTVNDKPNVASTACPSPPARQASNLNQLNSVSPGINYSDNCAPSLTSRVRPTPSPRLNLSLSHITPASNSSSTPTVRPPIVPPRLSHLARLNSYSVPLNQDREPSESSSSNDHNDAVEDEIRDYHEGSVHSDSTSDDDDIESSQFHGNHAAVSTSLLPPSFLLQTRTVSDEWITRGIDTPSASKPLRIPVQLPSHNSAHPEDQNSSTAIVSSPAQRARLLLLSPASPPPSKPNTNPRPSGDSRRSHSAVDLSQASPDAPSSGFAKEGVNNENIYQSSLFGPLLPSDQNRSAVPPIIIHQTNVASTSSPVEPLAAPRIVSSSDPVTTSQRHQSMYEFRPWNELPPYDSQPAPSTPTITPREEEGRERLPAYSCAIHLEGWMPRKMEFKSPGVQAKDRSWKRQYVILHGTMIRIYRSDPRTHPLTGCGDSYSSHFIHSRSSSLLASTCGIDTRRSSEAPPLHFHVGKHDSGTVHSLKETAIVKAVHQNSLQRVYTLQDAESGLAADYVKRKYVVRVRAEGEQFLLQAKNDRGVIDLIEALQAATNVSLDLDIRPLPKFITLPRRRRRRRVQPAGADPTRTDGAGRREIGATIVENMIAEAVATRNSRQRDSGWGEETGNRMNEMLAEEQEAYLQGRS